MSEEVTNIMHEISERDLKFKHGIYEAIRWIKFRQTIGLIFSFFIMVGVVAGYFVILKNSHAQAKVIILQDKQIKNQEKAVGAFLEIIKDLKETNDKQEQLD